MRRLSRVALSVALVAGWPATDAKAAAPGDWSVAVERLFGFSRTTTDLEPGDKVSVTSVSLFAKPVGDVAGYSVPRLAFDYLAASGVSFGGAIGYQSFDTADGDAWLFVGRVGYFARISSGFGLWPRAGLTYATADFGNDVDATALTLEVPLEFLLGRGLALGVIPHADIGVGGSAGSADRTVTEIGLQFGAGVFF